MEDLGHGSPCEHYGQDCTEHDQCDDCEFRHCDNCECVVRGCACDECGLCPQCHADPEVYDEFKSIKEA